RKVNLGLLMCSRFWSEPVSRLSTQITWWSLASRWSHRWEPRNPAPPVTMQVLTAGLSIAPPAQRLAGWLRLAPLLARASGSPSGFIQEMRADSADPLSGSRREALTELASWEASLRRTARRYSLCADDAEDAYQRAVLILLTRPLPADPGRLAAWMQVVIRHEALAVRRARERLLWPGDEDRGDPFDRIVTDEPGPQETLERR